MPKPVVAHQNTPRSYLDRVMGERILSGNQSQINRAAEIWRISEHMQPQERRPNTKTPQKQKTKASRHSTRQLKLGSQYDADVDADDDADDDDDAGVSVVL